MVKSLLSALKRREESSAFLRKLLVPARVASILKDMYATQKRARRDLGLITGRSALNACRSARSSDTLFVLGSGASVLGYGPDQWDVIERHDSVGFNKGHLIDHIPNFYSFELAKSDRRHENICRMIRNIGVLRERYAGVRYLIKDTAACTEEEADWLQSLVGQRMYSLPTASVPARNLSQIAEMARALHLVRRSRLLGDFVLQQRASLLYLIDFGLRVGYTNIVLCAIDLNTKYFFECEGFEPPPGTEIYVNDQPSENISAAVHKTNDPNYGLPIVQIIDAYAHAIAEREGVRLFADAADKPLAQHLPVYSW